MKNKTHGRTTEVLWDVSKRGLLENEYVPTADNITDMFTKRLQAPRFRLLQDKLVSDLQVFITNGSSFTAKLLFKLKRLDMSA